MWRAASVLVVLSQRYLADAVLQGKKLGELAREHDHDDEPHN
jgi:hypothetical protein